MFGCANILTACSESYLYLTTQWLACLVLSFGDRGLSTIPPHSVPSFHPPAFQCLTTRAAAHVAHCVTASALDQQNFNKNLHWYIKSNQIKFINIQQQIIKSTHVKKENKMNNVRILKGEVGHKWLWYLPSLAFTCQKLWKIKYVNKELKCSSVQCATCAAARVVRHWKAFYPPSPLGPFLPPARLPMPDHPCRSTCSTLHRATFKFFIDILDFSKFLTSKC